jgi:hypothetical protein
VNVNAVLDGLDAILLAGLSRHQSLKGFVKAVGEHAKAQFAED